MSKHEQLYARGQSSKKQKMSNSLLVSEPLTSAIPKINRTSLMIVENSNLPKSFIQRQRIKSFLTSQKLETLKRQTEQPFRPELVAKFKSEAPVA